MKKRRLKKYVLPTLYVMIIVVSFFSVAILNNLLLGDLNNYDYSQSIIENSTLPVLSDVSETKNESVILKPYLSEKVTENVGYYNKDDEEEKQRQSLIYYKNTYMPSTGIIYTSEEDFDVISVYDGEIKNISEDDILGTTIEVAHNTNLTTYYYSLKDVNLKVNDIIKAGTVLGKASTNKIYDNENCLLFEVYYQGKSLDPNTFYTMAIDELQ